jgi:putative transposase
MPWKETAPMHERLKFIAAASDETRTFVSVCAEFGISTKTGYKWLSRYAERGPAGLEAKAPVAQTCPHKTADAQTDLIVALRKQKPFWGAKKLRGILKEEHPELSWPAASTVGDLLKRQGLIRPRRRRVRVAPASQPLGECTRPNDTWCIDFKGDFAMGDGKRCHPLTVTDAVSRYLIKIEAMIQTRGPEVRRAFELAFQEFGLPSRIRSDNGPPFATKAPGGLSSLSVWFIQLGIYPERIEPGKPEQNGRHERFHRTLKLEALGEPGANVVEQQRIFDVHRHEYNDRRPHEALDMTPPAKHYEPSSRAYPKELVVPSYTDDFKVRWTGHNGRFSWRAHAVLVHHSVSNQPIGIRQTGESTHEVWYGPVLLGLLDETDAQPRIHDLDRSDGSNSKPAGKENPDSEKKAPVSPTSNPGIVTPQAEIVT